MKWTSALDLTMLGSGFDRSLLPNPYSRLIANSTAEQKLRDLAADSAGIAIEFSSNTSHITANYTLLSGALDMWHMPSTGVSGIDAYSRIQPSDNVNVDDNVNGEWMFVGVLGVPSYPFTSGDLNCGIVNVEGITREWRLHLPTYNNIADLQIGVDDDASVIPTSSIDTQDALVWYGSSIAQGAVASRPGNIFTNIIRNRLGIDVINLGFSGSCHMDSFVADEIVKIDRASTLVIDCLPNMDPEEVTEKTYDLVQQIKSARPEMKIILAEDTTKGGFWLSEDTNEFQTALRKNMKSEYDRLIEDGVDDLFYVTAEQLYNVTTSPTTEGTHLSDVGMETVANFYIDYLPRIVSRRLD